MTCLFDDGRSCLVLHCLATDDVSSSPLHNILVLLLLLALRSIECMAFRDISAHVAIVVCICDIS
jgi:hypothetical protein